jgi:ribose transport system permease protein
MNGLVAAIRARTTVSSLSEALREYAIVVVFIALFITLAVSANHFLTTVNMLNTAESGSIYGIVACALTLLLIVGEFDLSVGAIYVLSGIVAAKLQPDLGTWSALAVGCGAGLGIGLGDKITAGFQLYIDQSAHPSFYELGNSKALGVDYFVWIFIGFALVCAFILARTKLGRWLYATGGNPEAARLSGINTRAVRVGAFAFSGLAGGLAGAILISRTGTAIAGDGLGDVVFPAIAAVVVGGTSIQGGRGAIWRTVLGVFFLEFIRNGFNLLEVDPYYQDIIRGGIILTAVAIDALSRRTG